MIHEAARSALRLTPPQARLLQAATLPGPDAVRAFDAWRAQVDVATLDRGSNRLLPLLWHNLLEHGVDDPMLPLLKGVYRHAWFGNQVILAKLRDVEAALAGAGIPMLALKGVALAYGTYASPGLRPMDDLDVLVHPADVPRAVEVLRAAGWATPVSRPDRLLRVVNGTELHDAAWNRLDLHGHVLPGGLRADLDVRRWERAVRVDTGMAAFLALDPTDQVLHAIVHGALSDPPAIRWIADVLTILRRPGAAIDWDRLLGDATAEDRALLVAVRLKALVDLLDAPIPGAIVARAANRRARRGERLGHRIETGPSIFFAGPLLRRWLDYRRWRQGDRAARTMGFATYLRHVWSVEPRQLPAEMVRHAVARFRLDLGRVRQPAGTHRDA